MNNKAVSGIIVTLLVMIMLTSAFNIQSVKTAEFMDDYCWVDGESLDIGFSKYGEMISYSETSGVGVGLQYPGYEAVGTHDQRDGSSRDPFANEGIRTEYWLNGWLLEVRYTHKTLTARRILTAAMFTDMSNYGGDWIVGKGLPLYTAPYGGRKTTAFAETEAIQVLDDDPRLFKALCTTHIYDWEDSNEDEVVDHPAETWPVVDVLITIIFNKAKKGVIVLKDVRLVIDAEILDSPVDCQFSNRGEWDLGFANYVHFYHDPSGDIAQVISSDLDYVGWAAFWPHLSDYTVDGWGWVFDPLIEVNQSDMIPAGSEPDIPVIIGEWDFTLDYVDPFVVQFGGATVYGISDLSDGDDEDIGPGHENVIDSEVVHLHELVVSIMAPASILIPHSSLLNATVTNEGLSDEVDVELSLYINGSMVDSLTIPVLEVGDSSTLSYLWTPTIEGTYNLTAYAPPTPGEVFIENNQKTVFSRAHTWEGETIYIRPDGSIDPPSAPILRDGDLYALTGDLVSNADGIVIERNNMTLDGAGYTLQGKDAWRSKGIDLSGRSNVTIKNTKILAFYYGIRLYESSDFNSISGNNITNNEDGIGLAGSSSNAVFGNNITNNRDGIQLSYSSNYNSVSGNNITNNDYGISLEASSNNTISGNNITANDRYGVSMYAWPYESSGNTVSGNNITNNDWGVGIDGSDNTITGNTITDNRHGVDLSGGPNNTVSGNNITNNSYGIYLRGTSNNSISGNNINNNWAGVYLSAKPLNFGNMFYHNNFLNNTIQARVSFIIYPSRNTWDDGYPSGGNYWSDYTGVDYYSGPYQNETGSDGIGDTPYVVEWDNQDNYPLMEPWSPAPPVPTTIDELKTEIEELGSEGEIDNQGIVKSLLAKLNVAQKLVNKGKIDEAKSILEEDFIPQVQNLTDIHITPEAAEILVEAAEYIISHP